METQNADRVLEAKAPAKLNLFLEVHRKRPDGYHDISSVVAPVSLYDELKFEETRDAIELVCDEPGLTAGSENLAVKAATMLRESFSVSKGVRITLRKEIPVGAGLGGGSSDAATTLLTLNRLWGLKLGLEEMLPIAARLGADVPLFLYGRVAHITGRGEQVVPLEGTRGEVNFVVVVPDLGVSTRAVYERVQVPSAVQRRSASGMIDGFQSGSGELVARNVFNRLTQAAFEEEPRLEGLSAELTQATDLPVAMTGSGSAFFVCCPSKGESQRVSDSLKNVLSADVREASLVQMGDLVAGARAEM